jgi:hypothetical protein
VFFIKSNSGLFAFASNTERGTTSAQHEASIAASHVIVNRVDGAWSTIAPSDDLTISVRLSAPQQSRLLGFTQSGSPVEVIGTATYLPPAQHQEALANRLYWKPKYAIEGINNIGIGIGSSELMPLGR